MPIEQREIEIEVRLVARVFAANNGEAFERLREVLSLHLKDNPDVQSIKLGRPSFGMGLPPVDL